MNFSEKWGTNVEEAVKLALIDLKLSREEVEVIVLEEPSKGFFGIGSKLAKVRVEKKKEEPKREKPKVEKSKLKETKKEPPKKAEYKKEKTERAATLIKEDENLVPVEDHIAIDFLKETTQKMGLNLNITAKVGDDLIHIDIQGKDSGTVIGKRGQTLDAIQYLTSLVVNKGHEQYIRVVVDAEHYRSKRERTLEQLADRLAEKVVKTKRSVRLEPMNPYERKVIHATLQSNPKVMTKSEGEEPYRRVVIELK